MRIEKLHIKSFRGFEDLELELDPRLTILVGTNGAGKSSVVKALELLFSHASQRLLPPEMNSDTQETVSYAPEISSADFRLDTKNLELGITVRFESELVPWTMVASKLLDRTPIPTSEDGQLRQQMAAVRRALADDARASIPVAISYGTNRAVLDIPLRIRIAHTFDQFSAWDGALDQPGTNFRLFFEWFREREDLENELARADGAAADSQLSAVRNSIERILPGFQNLRVQRLPLRMTVDKNGAELNLTQLSDGEKCLLALVGDLSRRLAIANPAHPRPNECPAVVFIDEVELHLHPTWQRNIVPSLLAVYPECQFVLTTHSAQVLGEVEDKHIVVLRNFEQFRTGRTKGRDANAILEEVLGALPRSGQTRKALDEIGRLLDQGQLEQARGQIESLADALTDRDPEVARLRALLGFLEA